MLFYMVAPFYMVALCIIAIYMATYKYYQDFYRSEPIRILILWLGFGVCGSRSGFWG